MKDNRISTGTEMDWKALHYFNLYRVVLAGFFVVLVWSANLPYPLGEYDQSLFANLAYSYLIYAVAAIFIIQKRFLNFQLQVAFHVIADIIIISFMVYASSGLKSGFGLLIVITVACGSILSARQFAILFAAVATIMMLGHEVYIHFFRYFPEPSYTQAAFHGIAFFITSIAGHLISSRMKASEALAAEQALDIESLAKLNEQIVQRMQSGIIAVDDNKHVRLMNHSAKQILGFGGEAFAKHLELISPELNHSYDEWKKHPDSYKKEIHADKSNIDIKIGFVEFDRGNKKTCLIFLDDLTRMRQQAQSLKLASLGRLSASIAHEIRNPLGAISHAGQLLSESDTLSGEDIRMTEIIREHSIRINQIIENVMSMSRREPPFVEKIILRDWFEKYIQEIIEELGLTEDKIKLKIESEILSVNMDASQLRQVINNLTQNACRYSTGHIQVEFDCGLHELTERVYIDVIDTGSGIDTNKQQHLFEPFYTTSKDGTGLGLYIARELCEMNQATLSLAENSLKGCRFRIQFPYQGQEQS